MTALGDASAPPCAPLVPPTLHVLRDACSLFLGSAHAVWTLVAPHLRFADTAISARCWGGTLCTRQAPMLLRALVSHSLRWPSSSPDAWNPQHKLSICRVYAGRISEGAKTIRLIACESSAPVARTAADTKARRLMPVVCASVSRAATLHVATSKAHTLLSALQLSSVAPCPARRRAASES